MSIYVETFIRTSIEKIWDHTQTPELHERWDLRFSRIEYLPRESMAELQRFRYTTRIGFGLQVAGEGESVGERNLVDGSRSSALKFSSTDTRSIIREGSGYWKYVPTAEGVRFITWYEYRTRFGAFGWLFDRCVFQPLMGWGTAWSFDRLRLWLEDDLNPKEAVRHALVHGIARAGLAFVFVYHGLVPKLLGPHADETAMLRGAGFDPAQIPAALTGLGIVEILLGLCFLIFFCRRWPIFAALAILLAATIGVAVSAPQYLAAAFNPISLNLAVACLAVIDLLSLPGAPSAGRCRRRPVPS